jgi:outer membrane protein assembly factor BamE (lipoprotein component of BamABCDE complex)
MIKNFLILIITLVLCSSCIKTIRISGHLFEEEEIKSLKLINNKYDLEALLGSPTSVSSFGQETWYYITSKKESVAFFADKVIEQNIIAVSFSNNGDITSIARYNEKDYNKAELVTEYSLIKGNDSTVTQDLFKNFGRFRNKKAPEVTLPRSGF